MYESFPGKLTLHDGSIVGAVLTVGDDVLTISAEGITVGTWPLKYCRVARETDTTFRIAVDGEPTSFRPAEPIEFAQVAARRFRASTLADRIDVIRAMPPAVDMTAETARPRRLPLDVPRLPVVIGVTVLAIAALVTVSGLAGSLEEEEPEPDPGPVVAATEPTPAPTLATMTIRELTVRWNVRAFQLGRPDLQIDAVSTEAYEHAIGEIVRITVEGEGEALTALLVTVDTGGNANQRDLAYGALEVAVAVAEPASTREQRRGLLAELGVDTSLNVPAGAASLVRGGVAYVVTFVQGLSELTLHVAPA